jgi:hypothetical protein
VLGALTVVIAVAVWGAIGVTQMGLVWPWPQVLPGSVSFQQFTFFEQPGCHSRRWYDGHGGVSGAESAKRYGTLTSALWVGALPEYTLHRHAQDGYLLVPSGSCLVMYENNAN